MNYRLKASVFLFFYMLGIQAAEQPALDQWSGPELIGAMDKMAAIAADLDRQIKTSGVVSAINEAHTTFTNCLNQYLTNNGQLFMKKSGFFGKHIYAIGSLSDVNSPIASTEEYNLLVATLENAARIQNLAQTVVIEMSMNNNGIFEEKILKLQEIIDGIKQVPLPVGYSIGSIAKSAAIATAIAVGGVAIWYYYASSNANNVAAQATIQNTATGGLTATDATTTATATPPVVPAESQANNGSQGGNEPQPDTAVAENNVDQARLEELAKIYRENGGDQNRTEALAAVYDAMSVSEKTLGGLGLLTAVGVAAKGGSKAFNALAETSVGKAASTKWQAGKEALAESSLGKSARGKYTDANNFVTTSTPGTWVANAQKSVTSKMDSSIESVSNHFAQKPRSLTPHQQLLAEQEALNLQGANLSKQKAKVNDIVAQQEALNTKIIEAKKVDTPEGKQAAEALQLQLDELTLPRYSYANSAQLAEVETALAANQKAIAELPKAKGIEGLKQRWHGPEYVAPQAPANVEGAAQPSGAWGRLKGYFGKKTSSDAKVAANEGAAAAEVQGGAAVEGGAAVKGAAAEVQGGAAVKGAAAEANQPTLISWNLNNPTEVKLP